MSIIKVGSRLFSDEEINERDSGTFLLNEEGLSAGEFGVIVPPKYNQYWGRNTLDVPRNMLNYLRRAELISLTLGDAIELMDTGYGYIEKPAEE